jgi:hypothetical protein
MELITGHGGFQHVDASDFGSLNAGIFGEGKYILQNGNQFGYSLDSDNNIITILDGDGINQGRHFRIKPNEPEELQIENGTSGTKRYDLVVVRYTRDTDTGIEDCQLNVIKGTEAETPSDPDYVSGNILNGMAVVDDMPLYQITIEGRNITNVKQLFTVVGTLSGINNIKLLADAIYPIGSIYLTVANTDPAALFGGTWIRWGSGRVPVSVDESQEEFNEPAKTGGSKYLQEHTHTGPEHTHTGPEHTHTGPEHTHTFEGSASHAHTPSDSSYTFSTYKGTRSSETVGAISGSGYKISQVKGSGAWGGSSKTATATVKISGSTGKSGNGNTGKAGTGNTGKSGNGNTGKAGTGDAGNLQPYITCYMWKRTA